MCTTSFDILFIPGNMSFLHTSFLNLLNITDETEAYLHENF